MRKTVEIREAGLGDAATLGALISALLLELVGGEDPARSPAALSEVAEALLADPMRYAALLAEDATGQPLAVLALSASAGIYAAGHFGTITEFYVMPAARSSGIGADLVTAASDLARRRGWRRLEVGAPDVPRWQRSVDFYRRCGFSEIGPRLSLPLV